MRISGLTSFNDLGRLLRALKEDLGGSSEVVARQLFGLTDRFHALMHDESKDIDCEAAYKQLLEARSGLHPKDQSELLSKLASRLHDVEFGKHDSDDDQQRAFEEFVDVCRQIVPSSFREKPLDELESHIDEWLHEDYQPHAAAAIQEARGRDGSSPAGE